MWKSILSIKKDLGDHNIDLTSLFLRNRDGNWSWSLEPTGLFTVSSLRNSFDAALADSGGNLKTTWIKSAPSKTNIFIWRLQKGRLATLSNLIQRGTLVESDFCYFCNDEVETEDHVFARCQSTKRLVMDFCRWWNVPLMDFSSASDLINLGEQLHFNNRKLEGFLAALFALLWCIWKARNSLAFPDGNPSVLDILGESQSTSFCWINSRKKWGRKLIWSNWVCSPYEEIPL